MIIYSHIKILGCNNNSQVKWRGDWEFGFQVTSKYTPNRKGRHEWQNESELTLDAPSWEQRAERWDKLWNKAHDACLVKREPNLNQYRFYREIPFAFSDPFFCGHMDDTYLKWLPHTHHPPHAIGRRWGVVGSGVMSLESEKRLDLV